MVVNTLRSLLGRFQGRRGETAEGIIKPLEHWVMQPLLRDGQRRWVVIGLLFLLLLIPTMTVSGEGQPVMVISTTNFMVYELNQTIQVTLHVFRGTVKCEPDETPRLQVGTWPKWRWVQTSRIYAGTYLATITVEQRDVSDDRVWIHPEVIVDDEYYGDSIHREIIYQERMNLTFDPVSPEPGDQLTVTVSGWDGSLPAPVRDLEVSLRQVDTIEVIQNLTVEESDSGTYQGRVAIPSDITELTNLSLLARGRVRYRDITQERTIPVLPFHLWHRKLHVNETGLALALLVTNGAGEPLPGAEVNGVIKVNQCLNRDRVSLSATTDASGIANLTAAFRSARTLRLEANITHQGRLRTFWLDLAIDNATLVESCYRLHAGVVNEQPLVAGGGATVRVQLSEFEHPVNDTPVYYVLASDTQFVRSGTVTTNGQGLIDINLTIPELAQRYHLEIHFMSELYPYHHKARATLPPVLVSNLRLAGEGFTPGLKAEVSCQASPSAQPRVIYVATVDGRGGPPNWTYYGPLADGAILMSPALDGYRARFPIPRAFQEGQGFVVLGKHHDGTDAEMVYVNFDPEVSATDSPSFLRRSYAGVMVWQWMVITTCLLACMAGGLKAVQHQRFTPSPGLAPPPPPGSTTRFPLPPPPSHPPPPPPPSAAYHSTEPPASGAPPHQGFPPEGHASDPGALPMVTIRCPGCHHEMEIPQRPGVQAVRCASCELAGEIEL